jgi:HEAT repeat-containing protein 5
VRVSQVVVERCCSLICQKLVDPEVALLSELKEFFLDKLQVSLTAAHCAKTLILASTSGNKITRQCPRLLIPGMIEFIAKNVSIEDGKASEAQMTALGEVWKAISILFSSTPEGSRMY